MIQIDTSMLSLSRVLLPSDWQEMRLARTLPDGALLRYQTPDAFFNPEFDDPPEPPYPGRNRRYCILGNHLIVGGVAVDAPLQVEIAYYQSIPPLTDEVNNWPNIYALSVYTLKILHVASLYAIEDQRSAVWDQEVVRMVNGMNAQHKIDQASGSVLVQTRRKSFG